MAKKTEKTKVYKRYTPLRTGQKVELRHDQTISGVSSLLILKKGARGVVTVPKLLNGNCVVDIFTLSKGTRAYEITRSNIRVLPMSGRSDVARKPTSTLAHLEKAVSAGEERAKRATRESSPLFPDLMTAEEFENILDEHEPQRVGTKWYCECSTKALNLLLRAKVEAMLPTAEGILASLVYAPTEPSADGPELDIDATARELQKHLLTKLAGPSEEDKALWFNGQKVWDEMSEKIGRAPNLKEEFIAAYVRGAKESR